MTEKFSRLSAEQRSELVAYLDGELDDQQTVRIESVLAESAVARNDVEMLARTYDLLDELPRVKAPEEFTQQTMTTIRLEQVRPDITESEWYRRARGGMVLAAWTLAMVAASSIGFLITNAWAPNEAEILVEDFEVIENLDEYIEAGSIEFLEALHKEPEVARQLVPERSVPRETD